MSSPRLRWCVMALCCLSLAVPIVAVEFPPVTDLPQQVAQIRLFLQTLGNGANPLEYEIQWTKPGNGCYLILAGGWALFGPEKAGRVCLFVIVVLWGISVHLFAAKFSRPLAGGILSSILAYNLTLYWGFLSFMLGLPAFIFLIYVLKCCSLHTWRGVFAWIAAAFLLYFSHILWLIFAFGYIAVHGLMRRGTRTDTLLQLCVFAPFILGAACWSASIGGSIDGYETYWFSIPFLERLRPEEIVPALFGYLRGPIPYVYTGIIGAYILVIILSRARTLRETVDMDLLLASALLLVATQALPDTCRGAVFFWDRWVAPAMVLLLLALPGVPLGSFFVEVSFCVLLCLHSLVTTQAWTEFQRKDMSGLVQAINALPINQAVFGVAQDHKGTVVDGFSLLHAYSYAQVIKGGTLNVSFAYLPSSLVYTRKTVDVLMRLHHQVRKLPAYSFIKPYDYAIVAGTDAYHKELAEKAYLETKTETGYWRLYKIVHH